MEALFCSAVDLKVSKHWGDIISGLNLLLCCIWCIAKYASGVLQDTPRFGVLFGAPRFYHISVFQFIQFDTGFYWYLHFLFRF